MEVGLNVKFSGVIPPQSDLRERETARQRKNRKKPEGKRKTKGQKEKKKKKNMLRIGTWNVLTLLQTAKLENVKREMGKHNLN